MKKAFLILILTIPVRYTRAGDFPGKDRYLSAGVYAGYTFGAGFTFGYEVNAGLARIQNSLEPVNAGVTFGRYWVHVRYRRTNYTHRIRFFGAMAESNYFDTKIGFAQARNRWGRTSNNRCRVGGIYYDISFTSKDPYAPWIGIKRFNYPAQAWAWFWRPYNTVYVKYKYDVLGTSGIKPGQF